jgi:hypothetical protein
LNKEEVRENQENVTGTAIEGKINSNLFSREIDLQDLEQWLKKIKSINKQLRLFYNEKEL